MKTQIKNKKGVYKTRERERERDICKKKNKKERILKNIEKMKNIACKKKRVW